MKQKFLTIFFLIIVALFAWFLVFQKDFKKGEKVFAGATFFEIFENQKSNLLINIDNPPLQEDLEKKNLSSWKSINQQNILNIINIERIKKGLFPLKQNAKLTQSAIAKNNDMFQFQYFSHISPYDKQKNFSYFIEKQEYQFFRISENLAIGDFSTAQEVVDAWMKSDTHRENIFLPYYIETGISVRYDKMEGEPVVSIVQHFATPRMNCLTASEIAADIFKNFKKNISDTQEDVEITELDKKNNLGLVGTVFIEKYKDLKNLKEEYEKQLKIQETCFKDTN